MGEKIYYDIVKHRAISKLHKLHVFPYYDTDSQTEHFLKENDQRMINCKLTGFAASRVNQLLRSANLLKYKLILVPGY